MPPVSYRQIAGVSIFAVQLNAAIAPRIWRLDRF